MLSVLAVLAEGMANTSPLASSLHQHTEAESPLFVHYKDHSLGAVLRIAHGKDNSLGALPRIAHGKDNSLRAVLSTPKLTLDIMLIDRMIVWELS